MSSSHQDQPLVVVLDTLPRLPTPSRLPSTARSAVWPFDVVDWDAVPPSTEEMTISAASEVGEEFHAASTALTE